MEELRAMSRRMGRRELEAKLNGLRRYPLRMYDGNRLILFTVLSVLSSQPRISLKFSGKERSCLSAFSNRSFRTLANGIETKAESDCST
jgi:hypothetical protein